MKGRIVETLLIASMGVTCAFANQIHVKVGDASDLMTKAANSVAGDTIWVPAGEYDVSPVTSLDPGRGGKGWNRGLLWLGLNNGTAEHPIVLAGEDPANPPSIHGKNVEDYSIVVHIENDYVILKNLKIHTGSGAVTLDNANHITIEDCELFHTGQEIVHVRDSSSYVLLNRNHIHDSGNGSNKGTYGEGIYIGTSMESWGVDGEPESLWGTTALEYRAQNRLTYFDWRVNHVNVSCNLIHAISSENIDIKEGTADIVISKNMFSADSLYRKENPRDCDNSFVEVKGIKSTVVRNYMYTANNPKLTAYIDEYNRSNDGSNVPQNLTPDRNAKIWCDESGTDRNMCGFGENMFIDYIGEVRNLCDETFRIPGKSIAYSDKFKAVPEFPWVATSVTAKYEAEDATVIPLAADQTKDPASVAEKANASGGKYVAMKKGEVSFDVTAPKSGKYILKVGYSFVGADESKYKEQPLYVNDEKIYSLHFPATSTTSTTFREIEVPVWLNEGSATLRIGCEWGWVDLDYIQLVGAGEFEELFPKAMEEIPTEPQSSSSSEASDALAGQKLFSGMHVGAAGRSLSVFGAPVGETLYMLDAQGRILQSVRINTSNFTMPLKSSGIRILKVGPAYYRVNVR